MRLPTMLTVAMPAAVLLAGVAVAQGYPAKPVRVIVPFPAGAGADAVVRLFTPRLAEVTGQQFIVDNRAGAAGNIGAEAAARAPADGYTLLNAPASLASSQSMYRNLPFDLVKDFEPVVPLAQAPFVLAVHPSVPAKTVKEMIALARSKPGLLTFASTGVGGTNHLSGELFKNLAGIDIVHVPYKGTAQAVPDLIGGQVSMMFTATVSSLPHVKAGRLRALGVSTSKRSLAAPELPTIAESGLPGYESITWFALLAPTGTPREIIARVNALVTKVGQTPEVRDRLLAQGVEPWISTPEDLGKFVRGEIVKWTKVIAMAGVKPE
jgi:tripartite-type tricarboxylate transporter receptor subunit TctC